MVIERVRASCGGGRRYNPRQRRYYTIRSRWYVYYRVVDNGRIINTFLKKSTATQWVRRQQT